MKTDQAEEMEFDSSCVSKEPDSFGEEISAWEELPDPKSPKLANEDASEEVKELLLLFDGGAGAAEGNELPRP